MPGRHDFGCVPDAGCGGDCRAGGHHGIDPGAVDVFPVCDGAGDVCLGDDAGRPAGLRVCDQHRCCARVFHQIPGRGHVVVLADRGRRYPQDVRDGGRGDPRMKRGKVEQSE
jgi:hypothetical protein